MVMKKIKILIMTVLVIVSAVLFYWQFDLLFVKPFSKVTLESIVKASKDKNENIYVLENSGKNFDKINAAGKIEYSITLDSEKIGTGKDIITDGKYVYIHSVKSENGGYRLKSEEINKYTVDGKYKGCVYSNIFEEAKLVSDIEGMYFINSEFAYTIKNEDSFSIYSEDNELIKNYPLEDTKLNINSIAIAEDNSKVFYCKLNGEIYEYIDGKQDKLWYSSDNIEELNIPRSICLDEQNNLYFSDIGRREIYKLSEDGQTELIQEYDEGTPLEEKDICYYIDATNGLISVSEYTVKNYGSEGVMYVYEAKHTTIDNVICCIEWFFLLIDAIIAAIILIWIIKYIIFKSSKFVKLGIAIVSTIFLIALIFMGIILPQFKKLMLDEILNQAQAISDSTVKNIPYDSLHHLTKASDYDSESYKNLKDSLGKIYLDGSESTYDFYCTIYTIQQENIITCSYCLQEDTGAIYPYDWEFDQSDEQKIITTKEGKTYSKDSSSEGNFLFVLNPIIDENEKVVGLAEVGTDLSNFEKAYNALIFKIIITILAVTVVIVMIVLEVLFYLQGKEKYDLLKQKNQNIPLTNGILRIAVFIIFFVTNLSTGFLPNYAMKISGEGGIIPKEIMAAIPISAEVVVGAIFSIWGNKVINKLGEKKTSIVSSVLIILGFGMRIIPNIWVLTIGNGMIGAGWGVLLLLINTMIAMKDDEREKDDGFAGYSAAALNGVNCGVVFGGLLTNWFNYNTIFILTAIFSIAILIYSRKYLSNGRAQGIDEENQSNNEKVTFSKFIFNRKIITYFVMIVIPVIACGYFLNYMFPILGAQYGLSDTNIGYSYLLNGICVICLSNVLTRVFSKKVSKKLSLVISVILYAIAFVFVAKYQNVYAILAALILLGISDSFGLPIQTGYYTDLDIVKKYGYDKAIGIYSLFENIAQAAGSFVFSWVLIFGVGDGLRLVAEVILILALLFVFSSLTIGKSKKKGKLNS